MQINSIHNYYNNQLPKINTNPAFGLGGKPITLQYVVEKRSHLLPVRVLEAAKEILNNPKSKIPTLMELHKAIYSPILECKTLDEIKEKYPEFKDIKEKVEFLRESVYTRNFNQKAGANFVINTLKDYWCNLKNLDDIAKELGMTGHSSLERALQRANFVNYSVNYKTLLKASDPQGNKIIAEKTTAWNRLHPDLMYAHNKHAAQSCKTDEYKQAQAQRIKNFYKTHPERREILSESLRESWQNCPEIKKAMSDFLKTESSLVKHVIAKKKQGQNLTDAETKIASSFYKHFWDAYPEYKSLFAEAKRGSKIL